MRKKNKKPPVGSSCIQEQENNSSISSLNQSNSYYDGERLIHLLKLLNREIESAKLSQGLLPEKLWIKQQFSIGVNDVTRTLERMAAAPPPADHNVSSVQLQAVILASDCNPKSLTKHIPALASSRNVPLIFVRDKKGGSLRLGELVKMKTAIAIGVKVAKGTGINKLVEEILTDNRNFLGSEDR